MSESYEIPGFSRYYVRLPFEIVSKFSNQPLCQFPLTHGRGALRVTMTGDDGKRVQRSILTVAALAFHGQPPSGYQAVQFDDEITPKTVRWESIKRVNQRKALEKTGCSWEKLERIQAMYFSGKYTQDELAAKYDVSQATISRIVNGRVYR